MPRTTHHQLIRQQRTLVTQQDQISRAIQLEHELRETKKKLTANGYYELAAMYTNFDIAINGFRQCLQAA